MRSYLKLIVSGVRTRFVFFSVTVLLSGAGISCDTYPFPGVGFVPILRLPTDAHGVVLFDLGLPIIERPSAYGLSVAVLGGEYKDTMAGVQAGLLLSKADAAYGVQFGFANSARKGAGAQFGLLNFYNDESFRIQVGLVNTQELALDWKYGPKIDSGSNGVQLGLLNMSSEGGHFQAGLINLGYSTSVFQVGLYNFAGSSRCFQLGLINERDDGVSPFIGWQW